MSSEKTLGYLRRTVFASSTCWEGHRINSNNSKRWNVNQWDSLHSMKISRGDLRASYFSFGNISISTRSGYCIRPTPGWLSKPLYVGNERDNSQARHDFWSDYLDIYLSERGWTKEIIVTFPSKRVAGSGRWVSRGFASLQVCLHTSVRVGPLQ